MWCPSLGNVWLDSQPSQQPSQRFAVVTSISVDLIRQLFGSTGFSADLGKLEDHRENLTVITVVCTHAANHERNPVLVDHDGVFRTGFTAVDGTWPRRLATAEGTHSDAIDDHGIKVKLAFSLQRREQIGMQSILNSRLLPRSKPAMSGPSRAAEFLSNILPTVASDQHKPDHPHDDPVSNPWPATL